MKVKGVGTVSKEEAMLILSQEGKIAFQNGDITMEELGKMYKLELIKRASDIGKSKSLFSANYRWIPDKLKEELSPKDLGSLVDKFYECYHAGKAKADR